LGPVAAVAFLAAGAGAQPQSAPDTAVRGALDRAALLVHAGQPRQALAALAPVEPVEPTNPWLWFYRGSAYAQLGDAYRAMECLDHASILLADLDHPPPGLREAIRRQRLAARRQVFNASWRTGLAYDSNVSYLGDDAASLGLISGRPDTRFSSRFEIHYAPLKTADETLALGTRLAHSWHFAIEEFDYQDYGGYLRYSRFLGESWEVSLRYDYDIAYLGNEPFLSNHVVTPMLTFHWQPARASVQQVRSAVYYRLEARDYLFDVDRAFDRDGFVNAVGIQQAFRIKPAPAADWAADLHLGYEFASVATEGTEFDRFAHGFHLALIAPLMRPWEPDEYLLIPDKELTARFDANWEIDDYRERSLSDRDGDERSDLLTTLGFTLSQTLVKDGDYGDLVLHAAIIWTDARSNVTTREHASPYTYDKLVCGFQLHWSW
jgi:hypothetical protein